MMKIFVSIALLASLISNVYLHNKKLEFENRYSHANLSQRILAEQLYFLIEYTDIGATRATLRELTNYLDRKKYSYSRRVEGEFTYVLVKYLTFRFDANGHYLSVAVDK